MRRLDLNVFHRVPSRGVDGFGLLGGFLSTGLSGSDRILRVTF